MNRRIVAAFVAAALALGAFVSIFLYVRNADARALNGVVAKDVYVVVNPIAKGTLAENLGTNVQLTQIPARAVPDQAVSDLAAIQSKAASVDLVAGEVLLTSRFVDPTAAAQDAVAVPKGMEQMSLLVKPEQIRGGIVKAGETIGVVVTVKQKDPTTVNLPGAGAVAFDDNITKQILNKVLVTRIQGGTEPVIDASGSSTLPAGSVLVTVALSTSDIEKLTWAQSTGSPGTLLLTVENKDADDSSSQYTNGKVVLR
jgi:Flp pilus assembly protein CpaB